jgi:hypothetical protein
VIRSNALVYEKRVLIRIFTLDIEEAMSTEMIIRRVLFAMIMSC